MQRAASVGSFIWVLHPGKLMYTEIQKHETLVVFFNKNHAIKPTFRMMLSAGEAIEDWKIELKRMLGF